MVILDRVPKFLTISPGPALVYIHDHITAPGEQLEFVIEGPAECTVRTTVNLYHKRILPMRIEIRRLLYPTLYLPAVKALIGKVLRFGECKLRPEFLVDVGYAT